MQLIAKTLQGLENVLAGELAALNMTDVHIERRAVSFSGDRAALYRANLCCRTALRILQPIKTFNATNADEVYEAAKSIAWSEFMDVRTTFAIDATIYSETFRHGQFVAYKLKDAICDYFREHTGKRPSVSVSNPDLRINIHISHNACTISRDSSGESLHRRGYRTTQTDAPISEVLAAGMLLLAGWNGQCDFYDPMCGSGTFLIEAAMIALNMPPGIYRKSFAFEQWSDFDKTLFDDIYNDDSRERAFQHHIYGSDIAFQAIHIAEQNVRSAGLSKYIDVHRCPIAELQKCSTGPALIVTNPPYGERLGSPDLMRLYSEIGTTLKHQFEGDTAWVISSNEQCMRQIGLRPNDKLKLLNGALPCDFWKFELFGGRRNAFLEKRSKS